VTVLEMELAAPRQVVRAKVRSSLRPASVVSCMKETGVDNLQLKQVPIAKTGMLIRRPVAEVFEAFVNPDITTKFWFTKGSGRLEIGKQVQWDWEMYGGFNWSSQYGFC
jgi:hypothetical protein